MLCARKPPATLHTKDTRYLRLTACRALQLLQDRAGAQPKCGTDQNWTGVSPVRVRVFLEMRNGAELYLTVRHLLQFRNIQWFILD